METLPTAEPHTTASSTLNEHLSGYKWGCLKRVRVRYLKKKAMVASTIDVKDEEEQKIVNTSGKIFIEKYLLPPQHDDYHMLLRFLKTENLILIRRSNCGLKWLIGGKTMVPIPSYRNFYIINVKWFKATGCSCNELDEFQKSCT